MCNLKELHLKFSWYLLLAVSWSKNCLIFKSKLMRKMFYLILTMQNQNDLDFNFVEAWKFFKSVVASRRNSRHGEEGSSELQNFFQNRKAFFTLFVFSFHLAWAASCLSCHNYHVKFSCMFRKWRKMFTTGRWKQEIKILTRGVPRTIKQLMKGL